MITPRTPGEWWGGGEARVVEPVAAEPEQVRVHELDRDATVTPRRVGDVEAADDPAARREGRVALEEKVVERRIGLGVAGRRLEREAAACRMDLAPHAAVVESSEAVREAVRPRADERREPVGDPLGQEEDAAVAAVAPHVRPDVEKRVMRQRRRQQRGQLPAPRRSQVALRERDQADVRVTVVHVQRQRHERREPLRVDPKVHEHHVKPVGGEHRAASVPGHGKPPFPLTID
jgi:hypothetical protein